MSSEPTPPPWSDERLARAVLTAVCEPGRRDLARLVDEHGATQVLHTLREADRSAWGKRARSLDPQQLVHDAETHQIRFLQPGDAEWPADALARLSRAQVADSSGPPVGLWVKGPGHLAHLAAASVAIVGSRASTPYGDETANGLAYDLAAGEESLTVISGAAYGIDAAAHRGALAASGPTVAVLAGGLDQCYPPGNTALIQQIARQWLLVSEVPAGRHPTRAGFLTRNRLIAALAGGVVLVEAGARSGARNTASWAAAAGVPVMAVPGPVGSALSVTPHRLIRDGEAVLVADADDVRAVVAPIGRSPQLPATGPSRRLDDLPPALLAVREALPGRGGATDAELAASSGLPAWQCLSALEELSERGLVAVDAAGRWRPVR